MYQASGHSKDIWIHDTSIESYRETEESTSLLYVQRSPHQVRSPEDTGIGFETDEVNEIVKYYAMENVPKKAVYEQRSLYLETQNKLCQACLDVLNYFCKYIQNTILVSCQVT